MGDEEGPSEAIYTIGIIEEIEGDAALVLLSCGSEVDVSEWNYTEKCLVKQPCGF